MYELYIYILMAVIFESAGGMLYGVAVGFDPTMVFVSTLAINLLAVFASALLVDKLLNWRKGVKEWIQRRTARGQNLINKYAWLGVIAGTFVLSPIQTTVIGRLLCIEPKKFYPPLLVGTVLGNIVAISVALGIFKLVLHW